MLTGCRKREGEPSRISVQPLQTLNHRCRGAEGSGMGLIQLDPFWSHLGASVSPWFIDPFSSEPFPALPDRRGSAARIGVSVSTGWGGRSRRWGRRTKDDLENATLTVRLRKETLVTMAWIAQRSRMGSVADVNTLLYQWREGRGSGRLAGKLIEQEGH